MINDTFDCWQVALTCGIITQQSYRVIVSLEALLTFQYLHKISLWVIPYMNPPPSGPGREPDLVISRGFSFPLKAFEIKKQL